MSFEYFKKKLNYTLANEDSRLELEIMPPDVEHAAAVAGSGARVLPLFAQNPRHVSCVDLSGEQLMLTELRIEAARVLAREEFLGFFGYPGGEAFYTQRQRLFSRLSLRPETEVFFSGFFNAINWQSLLYLGRWEKTFNTISRVVRRIVGERVLEVFEKRTHSEQRLFLLDGFPDLRWRMALMTLGNSAMFNALLYRGHFPTNNIASSYYRFYAEAFNRIFAKTLARENFFLQIIIYGELKYPEGNPVECQPGVYERIQAGIRQANVSYHANNVIDWLRSSEKKVDFLSFSDVPSYFSDHLAKSFMQDIAPALNQDAITVVRSYMHRPPGIDLTGYRDTTENYASIIDAEKTQMYIIDVYVKDN